MYKIITLGLTCFLLCGGGAPPAAAAHAIELYDIPGTDPNEHFGNWVSGVGDVNGDGLEDFAAGGLAAARVYSGANGLLLHEFILYWVHTVGGAGDVNGDGCDDIIIGAPMDSTTGLYTGRAVVYSGLTGAVLWQAFGDSTSDQFGSAVSGAGDVNGDGYADFLVGAAFDDAPQIDSGSVFVYLGPNGASSYAIHGSQAWGRLGWAVSFAGDVDRDGLSDIIVGEPGHQPINGLPDTGAVRVYRGFDGTELFSQEGEAGGDQLGYSVADATDIDGDGYADVMAGAPFHDVPNYPDSGQAWVLKGPSGAVHLVASVGHDDGRFGEAVLGPGDRDGDGKGDFVFGAPGAGAVPHMYTTPSIGNRWVVRNPDDLFGRSLGKADVNGDGLQDTIIGKPLANGGAGGLEVWLTCVRSWSNYGFGWPGTQGIPTLTLDQEPFFDYSVTLHIDNSLGFSTFGYLMVGLAETSIPTNFGGWLLVVPDMIIPLTFPAGGLDIQGTLPSADPIWCHQAIYFQAFLLDYNATDGWSMTPGLKLKPGTLL